MSPEALDLGCAPASLAGSPSVLTFHPSLSHHPLSGPLSGPGTTHCGCSAPLRAPRAGQPSRPRWGCRGGPGSGAACGPGGDTAARAGPAARPLPVPRPPYAPAAGSQASLQYLGCARTPRRGQSRDFPSIITCPGKRCEERGPRLLRRDRGTVAGDGRGIHLVPLRRRPWLLPLAHLPTSLSQPSRWSQSTKLISLCYAAASH